MSAFSYDWETSEFALGALTLKLRAARRFDRIAETPESLPFGSTLWPAAVAMSEALVREPELVRGARALELGADLVW